MRFINHWEGGDFYDYLIDPTGTNVYNRVTRYSNYTGELPEKLKKLKENSDGRYIYSDKKFDSDGVMILGVYPELIFIPIKWEPAPNSWQTDNNSIVKLVSSLDYLLMKDIEKERRNKYSLMNELEITNVDPYNHDWRDKIKRNHIDRLEFLDSLGFEFDSRMEYFKFEYHKLFKLLGAPLLVSDGHLFDFRCNPKLSRISVNSYYMKSYKAWNNKIIPEERSKWIDYYLPKNLKEYLTHLIPGRIEEFLSSANEVEMPVVSDEIKRDSHGFGKDAFIGPNRIK